jgi:hypothetical protein
VKFIIHEQETIIRWLQMFKVQFTGYHNCSQAYLDFLRLAWVGLAPVSAKDKQERPSVEMHASGKIELQQCYRNLFVAEKKKNRHSWQPIVDYKVII